jgi:septum formation protein
MPGRFTLASASPRRAELLSAAGFEFDVCASGIAETPAPGEAPRAYTLRVAREKAMEVSAVAGPAAVVLAADTEVVADCRILGKPADPAHAVSILRLLSGAVHEVLTAVVIRSPRQELTEVVATRVRFAALSDEEIRWYVETGEPMGKAGAYAIQGRGARFVEWIEGSWSNVVGLPISTVHRLLREVAVE